MKINQKNIKRIPKEWFFFNPFNKLYDKYFFKISKKTGVIFFYEEKKNEKSFFLIIKPYVLWCQKNKISFFIQGSMYWANKYKAIGIFLDEKNFSINNNLNFNHIKKKLLIAGKVHNLKEAKKFGESLNLVFISNVFKTKTYPLKKELSIFNFFSLCFFLKKKNKLCPWWN